MIPTNNRLAIKQYIRDKPVRWGIKSFLLCEAKTGYILDAEIYYRFLTSNFDYNTIG